MNFFFRLLFCICFFSSLANAGGEIRSAWIQLVNNRYCGDRDKPGFEKAGVDCALRKKNASPKTQSWFIFEQALFDEGAELQATKNQCIVDQLNELKDTKEIQQSWASMLTAAWVRTKKSELILETCKKENGWALRNLNPDELRKNKKQTYVNGTKKHSRKAIPEQWQDLCFNQDELEKIKSMKPMIPTTVPILAGADQFSALEKNRSAILFEKNGKLTALTDQDILNLDVSDLSKVDIQLDFNSSAYKKFTKSVQQSFSSVMNDRLNFNKYLTKNKNKDGTYNLSEEDRQFIYDDETIYQLLCEKDPNFCNNYAGLKKTDLSKLTTPQYCVFAQYEKDPRKDLLIFLGESYLLGKLAGVLRGGATVKQTVKDGLTLGTLLLVSQQIGHTCFSNFNGDEQKVSSREKTRIKAALLSEQMKANEFTKTIGFSIYDLETKSPACKKLNERQKNYLANGKGNSNALNCGLNILSVLPWLSVSLPAISVQLTQ